MKKVFIILIIALIVVIGFSLAACDNGNGGSGGDVNSGGNSIIGKWYQSTSYLILIYEFASDGRFHYMRHYNGITYSASNGKLTLYNGSFGQFAAADYTISGKSLTIFNSSAYSGIREGTYYKK